MDGRREGLIPVDIPPGVDEHFDVSFLERTRHPVEVCREPQDRLCRLLGGLGCQSSSRLKGSTSTSTSTGPSTARSSIGTRR